MPATPKQAQRKIDAIDKRIDAVRAELHRVAGVNPDSFDYGTEAGRLAACISADAMRRDCPGYDGIERSLFIRRAAAVDVRNELMWRQQRADERRAARESRKRFEASRRTCSECRQTYYAAA